MDFTMVIPVLIAFALSVAAGPVVIPVLRRLKMDQTEREDGVKSHLKKAGEFCGRSSGKTENPGIYQTGCSLLYAPFEGTGK